MGFSREFWGEGEDGFSPCGHPPALLNKVIDFRNGNARRSPTVTNTNIPVPRWSTSTTRTLPEARCVLPDHNDPT